MASWQYNFTKSISSAIASIRAEENENTVVICYASNPEKEYTFKCSEETLNEIHELSLGILVKKENTSLGKTIRAMINDQKLVSAT